MNTLGPLFIKRLQAAFLSVDALVTSRLVSLDAGVLVPFEEVVSFDQGL